MSFLGGQKAWEPFLGGAETERSACDMESEDPLWRMRYCSLTSNSSSLSLASSSLQLDGWRISCGEVREKMSNVEAGVVLVVWADLVVDDDLVEDHRTDQGVFQIEVLEVHH